MRETLAAGQVPTAPPTRLLERRVTPSAVVAAFALVVTGMRLEIYQTVTAGVVVAALLAPLWLAALSRYRGARLLLLVGAVAGVTGVWLTQVAATDHRTSTKLLVATTMTLVGFLFGVGVVAWARTVLSDGTVAILYGTGLMLGISTSGRFGANPWRFGFSIPVTVLVLALAWRSGRRWTGVVAALALGAVSALNDGRSTFAMLLLAALLTAWVALPRSHSARTSRMRVVVLTALLVAVVYQVGQGLILDGYLGEGTQQRTAQQVRTSGSVLIGARPELGASIALVKERPLGFGPGTSANTADVLAAKSGMSAIGYDPNNGYVEVYMLGTGIELHSVLADLWAQFGAAGVVLTGMIVWNLLRDLSGRLAHRSAHALIVFLSVRALWDVGFSPFYSAVTLLMLTVGLTLEPLRRRPHHAAARRLYSE